MHGTGVACPARLHLQRRQVQQRVMAEFAPAGVQPGTREVNGKLIIFARSVEQKGGGKGGKGGGKGGKGGGTAAT